jgi:hypothetical protein
VLMNFTDSKNIKQSLYFLLRKIDKIKIKGEIEHSGHDKPIKWAKEDNLNTVILNRIK